MRFSPSGGLDFSGINAYINRLLDRITRLEDVITALRQCMDEHLAEQGAQQVDEVVGQEPPSAMELLPASNLL